MRFGQKSNWSNQEDLQAFFSLEANFFAVHKFFTVGARLIGGAKSRAAAQASRRKAPGALSTQAADEVLLRRTRLILRPCGEREKRLNAIDCVGARLGVRARMSAAPSAGSESEMLELMNRQIGMIEIVIGVRVDDNVGALAASLRFVDELLAGRSRRPVVRRADQQQQRQRDFQPCSRGKRQPG